MVRAQGQVIYMTFTIANRTDRPQDVTSQVCFDMSPAGGLNEPSTLGHTFTWIDGQYRSLATTSSPRAAEKFARLNYNWLLLLYNEQPNNPMRQIEDECPWWIVDQKPDLPILVRETADRRHLVAISWGRKSVRRLMTNTHIPCLHTDPLEYSALPPGESRTWHGRIFMLENDPQKLMKLFLNEESIQHVFQNIRHPCLFSYVLPCCRPAPRRAKPPLNSAGKVPPLRQSKPTVRVAVAQMDIKPGDLKPGEDTVDALTPWMERAAAGKADLLVFPEYLLGDFHLPNALTDKLCAAAKAPQRATSSSGGWEYLPGEKIQHPPKPGTYANTVLVVSRDGKIAGKHRKMHSALGAASALQLAARTRASSANTPWCLARKTASWIWILGASVCSLATTAISSKASRCPRCAGRKSWSG